MKHHSMPDFNLLHTYFQLDSKSPSGLIWKKVTSNRAKAGTIAGSHHGNGYWVIKFLKQRYYAHRIVYYMYYKQDPCNHDIDHIDQNKRNNNPLNLRLATRSQNMANTPARNTNMSGLKGVVWHKDKHKWSAQITVNYQHLNLGYFNTKEAAHFAYKEACTKHFKEYAHG
jgi:hypothetical protein